jgi:hypothetical protein
VIGVAILLWKYRRFVGLFFAWLKRSVQTAWSKIPAIDIKKALRIGFLIFATAIVIGAATVVVRHFGWPWLLILIALGVVVLLLTQKRYGVAIIISAVGISAAILICAISLPIFAQSHQKDDSRKTPIVQQPQTAQEKPPAAKKEAESSDASDPDESADESDPEIHIANLQDKLAAQQEELDAYRQENAAAAKTPQAPPTADDDDASSIEKPLASGRQKTSNTTGQTYRAPYTPTATETPEIEPASGDEGSLTVRLTGCRYLFPDEVVCEGYVESREYSPDQVLYVGDSSGVDDQGRSFNVWVSDRSIRFDGSSYPVHLLPGMKQSFSFRFHRSYTIKRIGISLQLGGEGSIYHNYPREAPVSPR